MKCPHPDALTGSEYQIHRNDHRRLGADLSRDPALDDDGVTIDSEEVLLWRFSAGQWQSADSLFGDPNPTTDQDTKIIAFWVRPPDPGDPAPAGAAYGVSVEVELSSGETVYGEWGLCLLGGASE